MATSVAIDDNAVQQAGGDIVLPAVALMLALTTLVSLGLALWLFRWRRRLPDGQVSIIPESVVSLTEQLRQANVAQIQHSQRASAESRSQYGEIANAFAVFSAAAASKDAEIDRLRKGGDKQVLLQFGRRFIRILRLADSDIAEDRELGRDTSALESLRNHLVEAVRDSGLEPFSPNSGEDYRDRGDVADAPRVVKTPDLQQDWKIARTIHSGFRLDTGDEPIIVERAIVEIFRYAV